MATALYLQRSGHQVTVLDPLPPAGNASYGNAELISGDTAIPIAMPGMLRKVPKWLVDPMGPLTLRPAYFPRALPRLLRWIKAARMANVTRLPDALRALHRDTLACWRELLGEAGGRIVAQRVMKIVPRGGAGFLIMTNEASRSAQRIVVATGAWSMQLLRPLGLRLPLKTERGYHALLPSPNIGLAMPVAVKNRGFVLTPLETGWCAAGTVEIAGLAAPPNERRAMILADHAKRPFPSGCCRKRASLRCKGSPGARPAFAFAPCAARFRLRNAFLSIALTGPSTTR